MVGFSSRNQESVNSIYKCNACGLIFRDPYQLSCGHRQCRSCVDAVEGEVVRCSMCNEDTSKSEMMPDRGFSNDMKNLRIICLLCEWEGALKEYEDHLAVMHRNPICVYCGSNFKSTDQLEVHKQRECPKITVPCPLKNLGCSDSVVRVEMHQHYLTNEHQNAIISFIHRFDTNKRGTKRKRSSSTHSDTRPIHLSDTIATAHSTTHETAGTSTEENIHNPQLSKLDGTLIWKITNIEEKMMDAQSERQTSIYSPPFYSSPTGYKMRACLYLNGDGNAWRTHMSLFFVLMRGPNDGDLTFPFNFNVAFCLYDQTPQQRHIVDYFRPDIRSNSFQRPRSEMNTAIGIPKFFPLAMIQQAGNPYVQEDTMFVKVLVDVNDLPETMLPYVLNRNPGLPKHIQKAEIESELQRRVAMSEQGLAVSQNQNLLEEPIVFSSTVIPSE